jgi:hypothetical protein
MVPRRRGHADIRHAVISDFIGERSVMTPNLLIEDYLIPPDKFNSCSQIK